MCIRDRYGENLAHDFARAQIALQSQQRGHAEGALHGAAYLAGDADGSALRAISGIGTRCGGSCGYRGPSTRRRNRGVGSLRMTTWNIGTRARHDIFKSIQLSQLDISILGAIAGFSAVAVGHPHRLDTLPVGEPQQVTNRAVGGNELLLDSG